MQPSDEPFLRDALDAQLDALAAREGAAGQPPDSSARRAYHQLATHFAAQAAEEAQAVERVRGRLASHVATSPVIADASSTSGLRTRELPSALPAPRVLPHISPTSRRPVRAPRSRRAALIRGVALALVVVILAGGFAALRLGGFNSPTTNSYHWTTIPSPNTTQAVNELNGITMRTATDGWAWGYSTDAPTNLNSNPISAPLVEHWNGTRWSIVPTPAMPYGGELTDIVSLAPDNAWAVGDQLITPTWSQNTTGGMVIEHWDGKRWAMVPSNVHTLVSTDDTSLAKLVALSPDDIWAVGTYGGATSRGLILHWDGRQWQEARNVPALTNLQFTGISASAPDNIWVVSNTGGRGRSSVFVHWDGAQWRLVSAPTIMLGRTFITSVIGVSANDVWAVGRQDTLGGLLSSPLFEHWDGQSWSVISGPSVQLQATLNSVAALGPDDVWAVGDQENTQIDIEQQGSGLVEHWDGQQWSQVINSTLQPYSKLTGVAGDPSTPGKIWIVGATGPALDHGDQPSNTRTFIAVGQP